MSGKGSLLSYWSAVPQNKNAKAASPASGAPAQPSQHTGTALPAPSQQVTLPFSPPRKTTGAASAFPISPMPIHIAPTASSSTPSRSSKGSKAISPESAPSSPDSFPPSPIQSHILAAAAKAKAEAKNKENAKPLAQQKPTLSPSPEPAKYDVSREIQDSDGDDFDSGSDISGDSAESLRDAVRFSEPFCGLTAAQANIKAGAGPGKGLAARGPSSSPNDSSSAPSVTKRRAAAAAVPTSPMPVRRAKLARVGWQAKVNPTKHKFDMKALLRHAKQEDATDASTRRVSDIIAESERREKQEKEDMEKMRLLRQVSDGRSGRATPLLDSLFDSKAGSAVGTPGGSVSGDAGENGGAFDSFNRERLRKALDRTEVAAVSESWYFFKEYFVPSPAKRQQFPQRATAPGSRWAFLKDASMRQEFFMTGVVRKALASASGSAGNLGSSQSASQQTAKESQLPEELFVWILNEACMDPLPALRSEYTAVLRCCPEQVRRFVDAQRLLNLFQKLGPRWESIDLSTKLELVPTIHKPYPGRDWSPLRSLLSLVAALADCLSLETVSCAVKILLRLGIDCVVEETPDILQDYQEAMRKLVGRVSPADWSDFCHDTASSLCDSVQKPSLRWHVLSCLPLDTPACHDMRRRLASALFFSDPERARQDPRRQLQQTQGLARLTVRDDLVLTPDTNFADLSALVDMLGVFLDDLGREALLQRMEAASNKKAKDKTEKEKEADEATAAAVRAFDADIDSLVRRLKLIANGIESTGGGHIAQLDSKTAFERLQIRLTHSVRTRPPGRKSIFDGPGTSKAIGGGIGAEDDTRGLQQKQQDIRNFFMQKMGKK